MANKTFSALPGIVTQSLTDIYALSANGTGSYKETRAQLTQWMQDNIATSSVSLVYFSTTGSDSSGTGTISNPFATYEFSRAYANSFTPSTSNQFMLIGAPGQYTGMTDMNLSPWVHAQLQNVYLQGSGSIQPNSFDWGNNNNETCCISGPNFIADFTGSINLDLSGVTPRNDVIIFDGWRYINFSNAVFKGRGTATFYVQDVRPMSVTQTGAEPPPIDFSFSDCYGQLINSVVNNLSVNITSDDFEAARLPFNVKNNNIYGNFSANGISSAKDVTIDVSANDISGTISATGSEITVNLDSSSGSSVPSISNGATVNLNSIGNDINANYSPVNYVATDPSVSGNLAGIDLALGSLKSSVQKVYVSDDGVDSVGRGYVNNPYATLDYAISQITDNSSSKIYNIESLSNVNISILNIKPNILINFNGNSLTVSGSVTMDSGWSSGGIMSLFNANNVVLPSSVDLDFSISSCPFALVNIIDLKLIASATTITVTSNPSGSVILFAEDTFGASNELSWIINNCYGAVSSGASGSITVNHTSESAGGNFSVQNVTEIGNITVTDSTAAGFTLNHIGCEVIGSATYQQTSTGTFNVIAKGMTYFSPPTCDNGISGGNVNFSADFLTALPILLNGATYAPTSLADAVNADYSPSNYSPSGPSVKQHLAAIDAALAGILSGISQQLWVNSVNGNDSNTGSNINTAFATLDAAYSYAQSVASSSNIILIKVIGNQTVSDSLNIHPYIIFDQESTGVITVPGLVLLDSAWSSLSNVISTSRNLNINAAQFDLTFSAGSGNLIIIDNLVTTANSCLINSPNTATSPNGILFRNLISIGTLAFSGGIDVNDGTLFLQDSTVGPIVAASTGSVGVLVDINSSEATTIFIDSSATAGGSCSLITQWSEVQNVNLIDSAAFWQSDVTSYIPPTLSGSATIAQVTNVNNSSGLNVDSNFTPVNYAPVPASLYGSATLTAALAGIDAALGSPIAQQLWINATNGNDSNAGTMPNKALATYDVGAYPIILANPSILYVVYIIGNSSVTSDFLVLPNCTVIVLGGTLTAPGSMLLDSSFSSANNATPKIIGVINAQSGINLSYGAGDGNLVILNIDPTTTPTFSTSSPNTTSNNSVVFTAIPNGETYIGMFLSGITHQNTSVIMQNAITYSAITITGTGATNTALAMVNSEVNYQVVTDSLAGPVYVQLQNTFTQSLTLDSTQAICLVYDDQSYPTSLLLTGGALIGQVSILGSTDGLAFSSTFIPANFSLIGGINWNANSLTAALAGLDAQLGSLVSNAAVPFVWNFDSGNSSNIATPDPVLVFGTQQIIGPNFAAIDAAITFKPTSTTCDLAFVAPYVAAGAFPIGIVVTATGCTVEGSGAIGYPGNIPVNLASTNSILIPIGVGAANVFYQLNFRMVYQYQNF